MVFHNNFCNIHPLLYYRFQKPFCFFSAEMLFVMVGFSGWGCWGAKLMGWLFGLFGVTFQKKNALKKDRTNTASIKYSARLCYCERGKTTSRVSPTHWFSEKKMHFQILIVIRQTKPLPVLNLDRNGSQWLTLNWMVLIPRLKVTNGMSPCSQGLITLPRTNSHRLWKWAYSNHQFSGAICSFQGMRISYFQESKTSTISIGDGKINPIP